MTERLLAGHYGEMVRLALCDAGYTAEAIASWARLAFRWAARVPLTHVEHAGLERATREQLRTLGFKLLRVSTGWKLTDTQRDKYGFPGVSETWVDSGGLWSALTILAETKRAGLEDSDQWLNRTVGFTR